MPFHQGILLATQAKAQIQKKKKKKKKKKKTCTRKVTVAYLQFAI